MHWFTVKKQKMLDMFQEKMMFIFIISSVTTVIVL